jgi:hypothetical protein
MHVFLVYLLSTGQTRKKVDEYWQLRIVTGNTIFYPSKSSLRIFIPRACLRKKWQCFFFVKRTCSKSIAMPYGQRGKLGNKETSMILAIKMQH